MEHRGELGTFVIPLWTLAAWWPVITTVGTQPEEFVWDWVEIPPLEDMFLLYGSLSQVHQLTPLGHSSNRQGSGSCVGAIGNQGTPIVPQHERGLNVV